MQLVVEGLDPEVDAHRAGGEGRLEPFDDGVAVGLESVAGVGADRVVDRAARSSPETAVKVTNLGLKSSRIAFMASSGADNSTNVRF